MDEYWVHNQAFIELVIENIEANLGDENFGPGKLANILGISQRSLSRKLRAIKKKSISQFIRETRLRKALEMLKNEDVTASEVAYKTGFGSPTYFNTCFHQFFGYPPGTIIKGDFDGIKEINPAKRMRTSLRGHLFLKMVIYIFAGLIIFSGLVLLVTNISIINSSARDVTLSSKIKNKSIAVLPFINLNDSLDNQYFIDGLMEETRVDLSRIKNLKVISRTSVEQFRGSTESPSEIGKKLHVDYIVEGSGQKYGNTYHLRVQLIEVKSDTQIWAESYGNEINETKDIFDNQNEIAQSIVAELKETITPEEKYLIEKVPTENLTAYYYYLKGWEELSHSLWPDFDPESVNCAETFFRKSIEIDYSLARSYIGLACVYWQRYDRDHTNTDYSVLDNYLDSMLILSDIAISYDDQLVLPYNVRSAYYLVNGNKVQALEECDKALSHNQNDWFANYQKGSMFQIIGFVKGLEYLYKSSTLGLGPELQQTLYSIGDLYYKAGFPEKGNYYQSESLKLFGDSNKFDYFVRVAKFTQGDFKKAVEHFESRYLKDSTDLEILYNLGLFNLFLNRNKESLKYYKKYLSRLPFKEKSRPEDELYIAFAYWQNGYRQEANYYFNRVLETSENGAKTFFAIDNYNLAAVYACCGEDGKAFKYLEIWNKQIHFTLEDVVRIKNDPLFSLLRKRPEFRKIVKDVESKYQAEHEKVLKWLGEQEKLQNLKYSDD